MAHNMRNIHVDQIIQTVARLCVEANKTLPGEVGAAIESFRQTETSSLGRAILGDLLQNLEAAKEMDIPICQDTGMAVVFVELGQEVHIMGGSLNAALHRGVAKGYTEGKLRCSVVADPLRRVNTGDNTPAIVHTMVVDGDHLKITVAPKGFGSENMSQIKMFTPAAGRDDVIDFIVSVARDAGSNPCPPMVLGVGIGGNFEMCALLAKKALCRSMCVRNSDGYYAQMESDALEAVNRLGIGPQGFGGRTTALSLNIETYPTHIAGLPVAVNMGCHVNRHKSAKL